MLTTGNSVICRSTVKKQVVGRPWFTDDMGNAVSWIRSSLLRRTFFFSFALASIQLSRAAHYVYMDIQQSVIRCGSRPSDCFVDDVSAVGETPNNVRLCWGLM